MKKIGLFFCLFIFPVSVMAETIFTHKDQEGTIHIYDQLNGPNLKTKDFQGIPEDKSQKAGSPIKHSGPKKIFEQEPLGQQTDRNLCLSSVSYKNRIETLRSEILNSEEKIETLHAQNLSQKEQIESFNAQVQNSGERIVTPLNLYPEEKVRQINNPLTLKVIGMEKEKLEKYRQELSKFQKNYSESQQEIQRRNIDCSRDD